MPEAELPERISQGVRTSGSAGSKRKIRRLRSIAAVLEKVAVFVAMAVLTYALIAVDTRVNTPAHSFKAAAARKV
jgi:hypothetical protein